jgi:type II secretory pathway pseudopilin PulG
MRTIQRRRGFTIAELLIGLVAGTIMMLGMGAVMFQMYRGFDESRDFGEATNRIDLIRSLQFDARTARAILFPTASSATGSLPTSLGDVNGAIDATFAGSEGDRVQFVSLQFDSTTNTTTPFRITWQSRRPAGSPAGTLYTVERWIVQVDNTNTPVSSPAQRLSFQQPRVGTFEIIRTNNNAFRVDMRAVENAETAAIQMQVTCRNVIN